MNVRYPHYYNHHDHNPHRAGVLRRPGEHWTLVEDEPEDKTKPRTPDSVRIASLDPTPECSSNKTCRIESSGFDY